MERRIININSLNSRIFSFDRINIPDWLNNYRLEVGNSVPVINNVRGIEVLDGEGIRNINQNQEVTNSFIENTIDQFGIENINQNQRVVNNLITSIQQQNLNNQLFVNENNLHIS